MIGLRWRPRCQARGKLLWGDTGQGNAGITGSGPRQRATTEVRHIWGRGIRAGCRKTPPDDLANQYSPQEAVVCRTLSWQRTAA